MEISLQLGGRAGAALLSTTKYFDCGIAGSSYLKAVDMVDVVDTSGETGAADMEQTAWRGRGGDGASTGAGGRWTAPHGGAIGTEGRAREARRRKRTRHHRNQATKQVWVLSAAPMPESQGSREHRRGGEEAENESGWGPEGDCHRGSGGCQEKTGQGLLMRGQQQQRQEQQLQVPERQKRN